MFVWLTYLAMSCWRHSSSRSRWLGFLSWGSRVLDRLPCNGRWLPVDHSHEDSHQAAATDQWGVARLWWRVRLVQRMETREDRRRATSQSHSTMSPLSYQR